MERSPGRRIAQLRQTHNLSREALAERSGLALEMIRQLEDEALMPDLAPLVKIARALGVRLGSFLDDQAELGPVISRHGKTKLTMRFTEAASGANTLDFHALAAGKAGRHMEPFIINVKTGSQPAPASSHEGEEFIFVLSGSVEILYGNNQTLLNEGDSIYYDSIVPHRVTAAGGQPAIILAVVYTAF